MILQTILHIAAVAALGVGGWSCSGKYAVESGGTFDGIIAHFGNDGGQLDSTKSDSQVKGDTVADADVPQDGTEAGSGPADSDDAISLADTCDQGCETDADCADANVGVCQVGICSQGCCVGSQAPDNTPCDDGDPCSLVDNCVNGVCAGVAKKCDDGQDCTKDKCDAKTGKCVATPAPGYCLIKDVCYPDADVDPAIPCHICDVSLDQAQWSVNKACCQSDADCPALGACDDPHCDASSGKCSIGKKLGCCQGDSDCDDANPCTNDACDTTSGNCKIIPKTCPAAPDACQENVCDPGSGQCTLGAKGGWCFIDGQCVVDGSPSQANSCQVCDPTKSTSKWSAAIGAFCNDNNACTANDQCDGTGLCVGTPQPGCCKVDGDCPAPATVCQTVSCNKGLGICVSSDKPGCCTSGICCDPVTATIESAKTACSGTVLATAYKCQGSLIQKADTTPGCNGTTADGCTSNPAFQATGPYATIQDCGAGKVCKDAGSGVMPTCVAGGPVGSCSGSCGGKSNNGTCFCDNACTSAGNCCSDFMALCGCSSGDCCNIAAKFPKDKGTACGSASYKTQWQCSGTSVQKRVGGQGCDGSSSSCSSADANLLWGPWSTTQVCPANTVCSAAADGSSASCKAGAAGSCLGACGGQSQTGACWCDSFCQQAGDCCSDFAAKGCDAVQNCGDSMDTCDYSCGGEGLFGGCFCDNACKQFGDCCPDKVVCGCP